MEKVESFENQKTQLDLFQDDNNLWHCEGRVWKADAPYQVKYPYTKTIIILFYKTYFFYKINNCVSS